MITQARPVWGAEGSVAALAAGQDKGDAQPPLPLLPPPAPG